MSRKRFARLSLAALGVVFGDIGTSPLYTVKECFSEFTGLRPVPEDVFGILSLITWALIIIVTVKYVMVVMRADNRGEGGVLALMALVSRRSELTPRWRTIFLMLGMAGAALFYGDCLLTPAISVLSAVEGLNVATPAFEPLVIPLALGVLIGLFMVQKFGTAGVGRWFGPIMLIWFATLLGLGLWEIVHAPHILLALSPLHALHFMFRHGFIAFIALGGVTLAVTGAEALYADMGHFGQKPIRYAWLGVVLPSLLANYYGQGALLLSDPTAIENPFFRLAPSAILYPMVALATAATVIASQATISGAFSMAQQATLLGLSPRVRIQHTSASEFGQIYVPAINWMQLGGIVILVLAFKSSTNLAAAYGIAVTGTMLVTTLLVLALAVRAWKWSWPLAILVFGSFMAIDATLMAANVMKFLQGGWVPLALALVIFAAMWTWFKGRMAVAVREREGTLPMETLLGSINPSRVHRPQGTAVYLTAFSGNAPSCLLHNLKHNEVLHEQVVLLTVEVPDEPYVPPNARAQVAHLGKGVHHVVLRYGFMEQPDVPRDLIPLADRGVPVDPMRTSYFVGRNSFVPATRPLLPRWQEKLFLILARFASSAGDFFGLPANRVVELGSRIEI
ncbi:KUP system potassium uptake protein [Enhydrobacter aerosaccus]|uniref:Probable potassium transport system protein Kup n=1 Tax=Enhydrobacter aerosaccus TaxID=225324 RepID=A0A1T4RC32_9HYPH|nr:potassium transporter Kup [Enhydrobacter aerosaccus]SKA13447.1 KUP system potassium uptake protein [Enhydrobacter aerosaccus]